MKTGTTLLLATALLIATLGFSSAPDEDEMPSDMKPYWLGLIYRGETWSPEVNDDVMQLQRAHLANIGRLVESGELVLAGPCGDDGDLRGLFFYDVETRAEAEALVAGDPAVAAGRLRVELHPWWGPTALTGLVAAAEEAAER